MLDIQAKSKQCMNKLILGHLSAGVLPVQAKPKFLLAKNMRCELRKVCLVSLVPNGPVSSKLHQILAPVSAASADNGNKVLRKSSCYQRLCPFVSAVANTVDVFCWLFMMPFVDQRFFFYLLRMGNLTADIKCCVIIVKGNKDG